jgi:hypothetical protein
MGYTAAMNDEISRRVTLTLTVHCTEAVADAIYRDYFPSLDSLLAEPGVTYISSETTVDRAPDE